MTGEVRDEFIDRAVRLMVDMAVHDGDPRRAAMRMTAMRADLAEQIRVLRDEQRNPELADALARLLGRLIDATEGGGNLL